MEYRSQIYGLCLRTLDLFLGICFIKSRDQKQHMEVIMVCMVSGRLC
jgi:hypothetical protein